MLTPYGKREWLIITAIAVVLAGGCALLQFFWGIGIAFVLWLAVVSFFRDPPRRIPTDLTEGTMLSPADGKISAVERVDHHDATGGPALIIRIFLSVLNVHVNRSPYDGTVTAITYKPGKFLEAYKPESAKINESNLVTMQLESGDSIGVRQVSGKVARRIVCPLAVGDTLKRGQKFGMIKFGSTAELILPRPDDVNVHVEKGQRVRGGLTMLATLGMNN